MIIKVFITLTPGQIDYPLLKLNCRCRFAIIMANSFSNCFTEVGSICHPLVQVKFFCHFTRVIQGLWTVISESRIFQMFSHVGPGLPEGAADEALEILEGLFVRV
jgi:hypothetical protein